MPLPPVGAQGMAAIALPRLLRAECPQGRAAPSPFHLAACRLLGFGRRAAVRRHSSWSGLIPRGAQAIILFKPPLAYPARPPAAQGFRATLQRAYPDASLQIAFKSIQATMHSLLIGADKHFSRISQDFANPVFRDCIRLLPDANPIVSRATGHDFHANRGARFQERLFGPLPDAARRFLMLPVGAFSRRIYGSTPDDT